MNRNNMYTIRHHPRQFSVLKNALYYSITYLFVLFPTSIRYNNSYKVLFIHLSLHYKIIYKIYYKIIYKIFKK